MWGILCSGPAAVVVFFIISGFCIHFPYSGGAAFRAAPYLIRRYLRIGIPMAVAMLLADQAGLDSRVFFDAVLWTLIAELMYYTLYPGIRWFVRRFGLLAMILGAFALSLIVVASNPLVKGYNVFGWQLNWLVGLPCWVLGVKLDDAWRHRILATESGVSTSRIWKWRLLVWAASSVCLALNFHSPIGHAWSLGFFAVLAYAWIALEIRRAHSVRRPWKILEWAGQWSYSLYLCHMIAARAYAGFGVLPEVGPIASWMIRIAFVLLMSYVFYLLIERPAHLVARRAAASLTSRLRNAGQT